MLRHAGEFAGLTKELYVEPLVGHLRHPHGLTECVGADETVLAHLTRHTSCLPA